MPVVVCPFCGAQLQSRGDLVGRTVECAECAARFVVKPPITQALSAAKETEASNQPAAGNHRRLIVVIAGTVIGSGCGATLGVLAGKNSPFLDSWFAELAEPFGAVSPQSIPLHAVIIGLGGAALGTLLGGAASFLLKRSALASGALNAGVAAPTQSLVSPAQTIAPPEAQPATTRGKSARRRRTVALLGCAVMVLLAVGLATGRIPIRLSEQDTQHSGPGRELSCESLASTFIAQRDGNERILCVTLQVRNNGPAPAGLEPSIDFNGRGPLDATLDGVHPSNVVRLVDDRGVSYTGLAPADFSPFGQLNPGTAKTGTVYFQVPAQHRFWLVLPSGRTELHPGEINPHSVPPVASLPEPAAPKLAEHKPQRDSELVVEPQPAAEAPAEPVGTVASESIEQDSIKSTTAGATLEETPIGSVDPSTPGSEKSQPVETSAHHTSPVPSQPQTVSPGESRVANRPISAPAVTLPDGLQWKEYHLENGNAEYHWLDREMGQNFRIVYLAETERFQVYTAVPVQGTEVNLKPLSSTSHTTLEAAVAEYAQYRTAVNLEVQERLGAEPPQRQRHEQPLSSGTQPREEQPKATPLPAQAAEQPSQAAGQPSQAAGQPPQTTGQPSLRRQSRAQEEPPFQRRTRGRRGRR